MGMTAPSADSARPPGLSTSVQVPDTLLHNLPKKTDIHEHPAPFYDPPTSVLRNSTHFLREKTLTTTSAANVRLHWKTICRFHQPPDELLIVIAYIHLLHDHIARNPPRALLDVQHHLQLHSADPAWLAGLASDLLPSHVHPRFGITVRHLPMTPIQLPFAFASDIYNQQPRSSEKSNHKLDQPYWNVIYDPKTDHLQVYANNRVAIYRRQRRSHRFVYLQTKAEATFPMHSTIAIGHWQNDYFVFIKHTPPKYRSRSTFQPSTAGLHVISDLHSPKPQRTDTMTDPNTFSPSTAGLHVISVLPSPKPQRTCLTSLHHVLCALSKVAALRSRQTFPPIFPLCARIPLNAGMLRRHLASFFAIPEELLEQNVDPG
jgi:hypothetical protein